jgi:GAF domain-containing protein
MTVVDYDDLVSETPALQVVRGLLERGGLPPALDFLNRRVPHRFTAVYRLDSGVMRNVAIVDKQRDVIPDHLKAVPFETSFCQFVLRDGFFRYHGLRDDRLEGHPYKGVVESYVGLPLADGDARLVGTFCHFDFPPLPVSDEEFEFMQQVAKVLPDYLP